MHGCRLAAILAASLLLSACFVSKVPLFGPAEADYPVPDGARFAAFKLDDNGSRASAPPRHLTVTRKGADYLYTFDGEEPVAGLLDDIGGGDYIALIRDSEKPGEAVYGLLRQKGEGWLRFAPECSDFIRVAERHGESAGTFNITRSGNDCAFSSYDDLKRALAAAARYTAPDTEYVRE
ncbi:MAG TPA: hypothetical protein PKA57_11155 [Parvibaculum sp.]|uniref:hypothetical protein n=1 Tax=Parvibaculum sp. TaxID=2024848 RepID=UPI002BD918F4|nr:hypothetical protein [Parvibaculum sp.]HMM15175.1 hypothetical protein [Parvibaculum sp.]